MEHSARSRAIPAAHYPWEVKLSRRNRATLEAVARILIPPGGAIPPGADELGVARRVADDIDSWSPRVRRQLRGFLTAFEYLPVVSNERRPFTRLAPDRQRAFLEATYRHKHAPRRLMVTALKQLCYMAYLSFPEVEDAVGYRYECVRPRAEASGEQVHH